MLGTQGYKVSFYMFRDALSGDRGEGHNREEVAGKKEKNDQDDVYQMQTEKLSYDLTGSTF